MAPNIGISKPETHQERIRTSDRLSRLARNQRPPGQALLLPAAR
jgi:hypothetical protein